MIKTKSGLEINIRQETPEDYREVHELVDTSFATNQGDKGDTSDYLEAVRKKDTFIPELSFVATLIDGKIVGQITLYHTDIITETNHAVGVVAHFRASRIFQPGDRTGNDRPCPGKGNGNGLCRRVSTGKSKILQKIRI